MDWAKKTANETRNILVTGFDATYVRGLMVIFTTYLYHFCAEEGKEWDRLMWGKYDCYKDTNNNLHSIETVTVRLVTGNVEHRDQFVYASSQWEMALHCNATSHWLGAYTEWSLRAGFTYFYSPMWEFQCFERTYWIMAQTRRNLLVLRHLLIKDY